MTVTGPDFIALQARDVGATAAFYETSSACAAPRAPVALRARAGTLSCR
jgi:hypothetical protein